MKVLAFSKNLFYGVGGAERSIFAELIKLDRSHDVSITRVKGIKAFNADKYELKFPSRFDVLNFDRAFAFNHFFYNEYLFNRKIIRDFIVRNSYDFDELWAQNIWAPVALNNFSGRRVYFARDESFLNERPIYFKGIKAVVKQVYNFFDLPGFKIYCKDNMAAINNSDEIIANSEYMAEEIKKKFNRNSKIILPYIDKKSLLESYKLLKADVPNNDKGIVFLGDSLVKGLNTVIQLAGDFQKERFYIFGRNVVSPRNTGNITYMPWTHSPAEAYKYAKVVIAPSVWKEAYGRVAAEATALSIPCVVNDIGGLPEAVNHNSSLIASDYADFKKKLKKVIG